MTDDAKQHALDQFATFINPQKVRVMKAAGLDIIEAKRSGAWVWDVDGAKFLDCFTSAGSFNVGRRNPRVVAAAHASIDQLDNGNFLLCSQAKAELGARLAEITPGDLSCTMFGTGGGEAIDFAIKLARGSTGRPRIISTVNGYHGHTGFALSAGGRASFRAPFEPLMPEFVQVPFGDLDALSAAVDERTAAVLLEPIQGEGGIVMPPPGYLAGVRAACDRAGALLILDEIHGLAPNARILVLGYPRLFADSNEDNNSCKVANYDYMDQQKQQQLDVAEEYLNEDIAKAVHQTGHAEYVPLWIPSSAER